MSFALAAAQSRDLPDGWMRLAALVASGVLLLAVGYFLDLTPTVPMLPTDRWPRASAAEYSGQIFHNCR